MRIEEMITKEKNDPFMYKFFFGKVFHDVLVDKFSF